MNHRALLAIPLNLLQLPAAYGGWRCLPSYACQSRILSLMLTVYQTPSAASVS